MNRRGFAAAMASFFGAVVAGLSGVASAGHSLLTEEVTDKFGGKWLRSKRTGNMALVTPSHRYEGWTYRCLPSAASDCIRNLVAMDVAGLNRCILHRYSFGGGRQHRLVFENASGGSVDLEDCINPLEFDKFCQVAVAAFVMRDWIHCDLDNGIGTAATRGDTMKGLSDDERRAIADRRRADPAEFMRDFLTPRHA